MSDKPYKEGEKLTKNVWSFGPNPILYHLKWAVSSTDDASGYGNKNSKLLQEKVC